MANEEHNTLTGSALHEPKGVAAASANKVYLSNGAGSGSWSTVSVSALANDAKAFQSQLLHVRDSVSSGSAGSAMSGSTWNTRTLQTVVTNEITSASLASNQISLPAGTYWCECHAVTYLNMSPGYSATVSSGSKLRLRNVTDSTTTLVGQGIWDSLTNNLSSGSYSNSFSANSCSVSGRFTLASTKSLELQGYVTAGSGTVTGGSPITSGENEIYADIYIWKIS